MVYYAFLANTFFLMLDAVCCLGFLFLYFYYRKKTHGWFALLFAVFLIDTLVLSMAYFLPGIDVFYISEVDSEPIIRSTLIVGYLVCYRMILTNGLDMPLHKAEYPVLAVLFLLIPLTGFFHLTPLTTLLYNSFTWGYTLFMLGAGILACRKCGERPATWRRNVQLFLSAMFLLELLAYLESIFWIRTGLYVLQLWIPDTLQFSIFTGAIDFLLGAVGLWYIIWSLVQLIRQPDPSPSPSFSQQSLHDFSTAFKLTSREEEVLTLLAAQRKNAEIAEQLHISPGTVKVHVHNIFVKAEVQTREELLAKLPRR